LPNRKFAAIPIPKLNYCDMTRFAQPIPVLSDLTSQLTKFGNGITSCPIKIGSYYLKNVSIDDTLFSGASVIQKSTRFLVQFMMKDENGVKPILVYKYKIFLLVKKN
jgi:hypothetical protein